MDLEPSRPTFLTYLIILLKSLVKIVEKQVIEAMAIWT